MSENNATPQNAPFLQINAQYIKDLSFEMPGAPAIFQDMQKTAPEISVEVNVSAQPFSGNLFESLLNLRISGSADGKSIFIVELAYAGLFSLNVPEEDLQPVLLIECPRLLFPFARSIISGVTGDAGLPPLTLQPIDFAGLYRQRLSEPQGHA